MLVVIPFFSGDKSQAIRLAKWIHELGGVSDHDCLLAVYKDTTSEGVIEPLQLAFRRVAEFSISDDMEPDRTRYQFCANLMWKRTALHIAEMGEPMPWLWLEPDAVPLTPAWVDAIAVEYAGQGRPFLLDLVESPTSRHNSGVGVYPAFVRDYTRNLWQLVNDPWDVFLAPDFTPHTHHTGLIHDMFWMSRELEAAPTFPTVESLSIIQPAAVIFHRNKDGSLIQRLREKCGVCVSGLNASPSRDEQEPEGRAKSLPDWPEGSTPSAPQIKHDHLFDKEALLANALARIQELEAEVESLKAKPLIASAPARTTPQKSPSTKKKRTLTPEHLAKLKAGRLKALAAPK